MIFILFLIQLFSVCRKSLSIFDCRRRHFRKFVGGGGDFEIQVCMYSMYVCMYVYFVRTSSICNRNGVQYMRALACTYCTVRAGALGLGFVVYDSQCNTVG